MKFTELLEEYLALRKQVQVEYGPLYERFKEVKKELDNFWTEDTFSEDK